VCRRWRDVAMHNILRKVDFNLCPSEMFLQCCRSNLVLSIDDAARNLAEPYTGGWHPVYTKRDLWNRGMQEACRCGATATLVKILKYGPNDGFTQALFDATENNYIDIVNILLSEHKYIPCILGKAIRTHARSVEMISLISNNQALHSCHECQNIF
jgi:hypothetical protein